MGTRYCDGGSVEPAMGMLARLDGSHLLTCMWIFNWRMDAQGRSGSHWLDWDNRPYLAPEKFSFLQRLKWFKRCLLFFWRCAGQTVGLALCRREGESIQSFVPTASLPWCTTSWAGAEHRISQALDKPCLRGTRALQSLPLESTTAVRTF